MSPMSPTQSCSPYPKGSSDPFGVQSPTMRTSYNGSNMEHQMRFDAFNSPVIQHHSGHPSPSLNPSATASATASAGVATDAAIRASESRSDNANSTSIHLNSSSLPASSQSNPVHPGSSNMPLQGSALYSPSLPVQSRISANPFDQPTSIIFGGGDMKSFSCPGVPAPALYGDLAHPQSQYPNPSYPLAMPYSQSPGPGTGPTPGPGYMMGPGSIPRQNQGPSPGSGPGPGLSHQQGMTQPQLYSPQQHQHQYQQQQLQQRNFDQRQYQMNQPVSYDAASGLPQGQRPPNLTTPGAGFTVLLSPGPLRAPAPVDPFSSVDALSWGLGVKKIDPYAPLDATPQSVTYSPSYTREQPRKASEMYRHTHTQTMQLVTPLPAVVNESTNPFDLY